MNVKIQYASDIHLEIQANKFKKIIEPSADILVLAGDIGNPFSSTYFHFLKWCGTNFKYVIIIAGNHEYYGSTIEKANQKIRDISKRLGVYFLERDILRLHEENLIILGTTLWSHIPQTNSFDVLFEVNDYKAIKDFSIDVCNDLYSRNKLWLQENIKHAALDFPEYKIVVVTHHAPIPEITSAKKYRNKANNCAYSSDCTDIMSGVDLWIFGHTHYNTTIIQCVELNDVESEVIVTSNQRGYPGELNTYEKSKTISL